ncbi:MAG TPA: hypothetical protein VF824_11885 [Thermoanaerobaculia bacterium]
MFHAPDYGVGAITVNHYPKSWDYAVVALLIGGALLGGAVFAWRVQRRDGASEHAARPRWVVAAIVVFLLMLFVHDHPYALMDPFHEGEHLTAGWLMQSGERPYGDFFVFHGLASDAVLDAAVLGHPPSPRRVRRQQTLLDALTLALLVPIAAEVCATTAGMLAGVFASLCAAAALWVPVFPYYRLLPVFLALLFLLRHVRGGRDAPLFGAFASATLGLLWSLDTGMYALFGVVGAIVLLQKVNIRTIGLFAVALLLPLIVLLVTRSDLHHFLIDSFAIMPKAIDPVWSLPAPANPWTAEGLRYFLPPVFYGFLFALALLAWRRGERALAMRIALVALFSALLFRTAAGRSGWSHTRFAMPLLGIAVVAFVLEPLLRARQRVVALLLIIPLLFYFELWPNAAAGAKLLAGWRSRQQHEGLVRYPFATGKGIYTTPQNATELAALNGFIESLGPRDAPILDFSNERALYYLLQRKPAVRCMEISMLSVPELLAEAMGELNARPPLCVIVQGDPNIAAFDGVPNEVRVPDLAHWIDANYPRRTTIGRFVVAHR